MTGLAFYSVEAHDVATKSRFVQQKLSYSDRLSATVGVRHDWLDVTSTDELMATTVDTDFAEASCRGTLICTVTREISTYSSHIQAVMPRSVGTEPKN